MSEVALQALAPDLWVASRPLPMWIGDIGCRMTIVRIGGDLRFHHRLDDAEPPPWGASLRIALLCGAPSLNEIERGGKAAFETAFGRWLDA